MSWFFSIFLVFSNFTVFAQETYAKPDLETVPYVDLARYEGKWFEIARIPNRFQKKCLGNVAANYKILPEEKLEVLNSCLQHDGETALTTGRAKIKDEKTNAKLKVSFVDIAGRYIYLFGGDYWVIDLDSNYQWAVIGTPNRKYGWILSRTETLDITTLYSLSKSLKDKFYDLCDFTMTLQGAKGGEKPAIVRLCDL